MTMQPDEGRAEAGPASPAATIAPPENLDVEDLLAQGIADERTTSQPAADVMPAEPEADEPDEGDEDESAEGDEDDADVDEGDEREGDEEGDEPEPSEAPAAQADIRRYAEMIAENPNRIMEVPKAHREDAFKAVIASAYLQGHNAGRQSAQPQITAAGELARFVAEKQALQRDDPDAFSDWADEHPDEAARYYSARAGNVPDAPPVTQSERTPLEQRADTLLAQLNGNREAQQRIVEKMRRGEYAADDAGLEQLAMDVGAERQRLATSDAGESRVAEERRQATKRRKARPKPTSSPANGRSEPALPTDYRDLLREGASEALRDVEAGRVPAAAT